MLEQRVLLASRISKFVQEWLLKKNLERISKNLWDSKRFFFIQGSLFLMKESFVQNLLNCYLSEDFVWTAVWDRNTHTHTLFTIPRQSSLNGWYLKHMTLAAYPQDLASRIVSMGPKCNMFTLFIYQCRKTYLQVP